MLRPGRAAHNSTEPGAGRSHTPAVSSSEKPSTVPRTSSRSIASPSVSPTESLGRTTGQGGRDSLYNWTLVQGTGATSSEFRNLTQFLADATEENAVSVTIPRALMPARTTISIGCRVRNFMDREGTSTAAIKKAGNTLFLDEHDDRAWKAATIAERLGLDTDAVSAILSRLKERGLVRHKRPYWAISGSSR